MLLGLRLLELLGLLELAVETQFFGLHVAQLHSQGVELGKKLRVLLLELGSKRVVFLGQDKEFRGVLFFQVDHRH